MAGEFLRDKMKILANRDIKQLFCRIAGICLFFWLLTEGIVWHVCHQIRLIGGIAVLFALMFGLIAETCCTYFSRQNRLMEEAAAKVQAFLDGDTDVRIACDEEGEIYRLFHVVNTLAAGLNAQLSKKNQEKEFLKDTISDISHQLKTPLAALNIYNGLMQDGTENMADIQTFVTLSEKELDRMEMLVQNLLKITKLDAGSIVFERHMESVSEMMEESREHFRYRAKQEQKHLIYSGDEDVRLLCDRSWLMEAIDNLVKNALDHTKEEDTVSVTWQQFSSVVQIRVMDNGSGIHPEDLYHIFKRFYRSRFSKETQGLGLGLPLAKSIIEAHGGTIEVDSTLGQRTSFTINFIIIGT